MVHFWKNTAFEKTQDIIRINPILAGFFGFFQRIVFFANPDWVVRVIYDVK